jgi:hypothetical protein
MASSFVLFIFSNKPIESVRKDQIIKVENCDSKMPAMARFKKAENRE